MTAVAPRSVRSDATRTIPAYFRLLVRGQLTRGRAFALGVLALITIGFAALSYNAQGDDEQAQIVVDGVTLFGIAVFVPLACLLLAVPMLGNLVEDRLLVYLWLKPAPRWHLAIAAFAAVVAVVVPITVGSLVVAALVGGEGGLAASAAAAAVLGVLAYGGLYLLIGLRFSWGIWLGLAHLLIYENLVATLSDGLAQFSVRSYLLTLVELGTELDVARADRGLSASFVVPLAVAVLTVGLTTRVLAAKDID